MVLKFRCHGIFLLENIEQFHLHSKRRTSFVTHFLIYNFFFFFFLSLGRSTVTFNLLSTKKSFTATFVPSV